LKNLPESELKTPQITPHCHDLKMPLTEKYMVDWWSENARITNQYFFIKTSAVSEHLLLMALN
jgi:hypothetical protein